MQVIRQSTIACMERGLLLLRAQSTYYPHHIVTIINHDDHHIFTINHVCSPLSPLVMYAHHIFTINHDDQNDTVLMIRWGTSSEWASTATWPSTRPAPPMASGTVSQRFDDNSRWAQIQLQGIFQRRPRCRRCRWRSRTCSRRWGAWLGRWKELNDDTWQKYHIADWADKVEDGPCREGGRG